MKFLCESEHMKIKHILKSDLKLYNHIINSEFISSEEKKLLRMIYVENQDYLFIGDTFGISESTVKKRHHYLLEKISKIFEAGL